MTWDAHVALHRPGPEGDCVECAINQRHVDRWAEYRLVGEVSTVKERELSELHRQDWIDWYSTPSEPIVRHDKMDKIKAFVIAHHGEEVTLQQIMDETGAAQGTAYAYLRELSLSFRRVGTSRYRVSDPVRARAEALAGSPATFAQDGSIVPGAVLTAPGAQIAPERPIREPSKP
jgi:hypothetical protein